MILVNPNRVRGGTFDYEKNFESVVTTRCKTVEECLKKDAITERAWAWSKRLNIFGRIIFLILLLGGIIFFTFTGPKSFSRFIAFFTIYLSVLILEFIVYHIAVVSLQAFATTTYRLGVLANLKEMDSREKEATKAIKKNDKESVKYEYKKEE